jgi:UDP-N-acetylmuramoyl-L-alanyl-D-glutamate--2,6-diaminopimelate ligase
MGEIAARLADIVIVTDDNPRMESAAAIRKEIMEGAPNAIEIGARSDAIAYGISLMSRGDILLVAGKGHENYQIIGKEKIHFDDIEEVRKYSG